MQVTSRAATSDDVDTIIAMYRVLADEQEALRPLWPLADGLAEPAEAAIRDILVADDSLLLIGEIDATRSASSGPESSHCCRKLPARRWASSG